MKQKKKKKQKDNNLLSANSEFSIIKNDKKVYLEHNGKLKQENNYTLAPKENKKKTNKVKVIILTVILSAFILGSVLLMTYAYKYDVLVSIFEFADNYLFLGAITLFVYLVFKSKK